MFLPDYFCTQLREMAGKSLRQNRVLLLVELIVLGGWLFALVAPLLASSD